MYLEKEDLIPPFMRCEKILVKALFSLLISASIASCATPKVSPKSEYTLETYKASTWQPYLILRAHDFNSKNKRDPIPALVVINGLSFQSTYDSENKMASDIIVKPSPQTNLNIEMYYVGKTSFRMERLELEKGDSVILDIKMKDDMRPLH